MMSRALQIRDGMHGSNQRLAEKTREKKVCISWFYGQRSTVAGNVGENVLEDKRTMYVHSLACGRVRGG